ncbi:MAG: DUF1223 domain-containing protein [Hyphomonadaceae bacterium]
MTTRTGTGGLLLRFGALAAAFAFNACPGEASAQPSVVELFRSQGCSSCRPANENILALADRPDLLVLSTALGACIGSRALSR